MPLCNAAQEKCPKVAEIFFSLLSTKTIWKWQTIFQTLMKTKTVYINVNKNCLQDILCVRDYVAVSRCFCHGVYIYIYIYTHKRTPINDLIKPFRIWLLINIPYVIRFSILTFFTCKHTRRFLVACSLVESGNVGSVKFLRSTRNIHDFI